MLGLSFLILDFHFGLSDFASKRNSNFFAENFEYTVLAIGLKGITSLSIGGLGTGASHLFLRSYFIVNLNLYYKSKNRSITVI